MLRLPSTWTKQCAFTSCYSCKQLNQVNYFTFSLYFHAPSRPLSPTPKQSEKPWGLTGRCWWMSAWRSEVLYRSTWLKRPLSQSTGCIQGCPNTYGMHLFVSIILRCFMSLCLILFCSMGESSWKLWKRLGSNFVLHHLLRVYNEPTLPWCH